MLDGPSQLGHIRAFTNERENPRHVAPVRAGNHQPAVLALPRSPVRRTARVQAFGPDAFRGTRALAGAVPGRASQPI